MKEITVYTLRILVMVGFYLIKPSVAIIALVVNPILAIATFIYLVKDKSEWSAISILILDLCTPIIGTVAYLIFSLLKYSYSFFFRSKYLEYDELPVPETHYEDYTEDNDALIVINEQLRLDSSMKDKFEERPYYEIVKGDDKKVKVSTIDILSDIKSRQAVGLLQNFLDDSFYEVRYFANNTLESIEKSFYQSIENCTKKIEKDSSSHELFVERGFAYLDFCESNLLDDESKKFFYEKAIYDFIFALALDPHNERAYLKVVHIYLNLKDYENVIEMASRVIDMEISEKTKDKMRFYMMEAYFELRNFKKLKEVLDTIEGDNVNFEISRPAMDFWKGVSYE
ncbi:MAG: hypothetical protein GY909_13775 [Oligoflexia bacterium]|nr:hypothetical protein [Oligoflexia bacterium]